MRGSTTRRHQGADLDLLPEGNATQDARVDPIQMVRRSELGHLVLWIESRVLDWSPIAKVHGVLSHGAVDTWERSVHLV